MKLPSISRDGTKTLNGCEPFDIYGIGASRDLKGPLEIEIP